VSFPQVFHTVHFKYIFEGIEIDYPVAATLALDLATLALDFLVATPDPIFGMVHRTDSNYV
jgi:hypothetical protein